MGARGDPHAWRALRDLVGTAATPSNGAATRQAFVDGFRQVAGIDLDTTVEHYHYRKDFDHGGMSGGNIDIEWWRDKGIPLLVDRAISTSSLRQMLEWDKWSTFLPLGVSKPRPCAWISS